MTTAMHLSSREKHYKRGNEAIDCRRFRKRKAKQKYGVYLSGRLRLPSYRVDSLAGRDTHCQGCSHAG